MGTHNNEAATPRAAGAAGGEKPRPADRTVPGHRQWQIPLNDGALDITDDGTAECGHAVAASSSSAGAPTTSEVAALKDEIERLRIEIRALWGRVHDLETFGGGNRHDLRIDWLEEFAMEAQRRFKVVRGKRFRHNECQ